MTPRRSDGGSSCVELDPLSCLGTRPDPLERPYNDRWTRCSRALSPTRPARPRVRAGGSRARRSSGLRAELGLPPAGCSAAAAGARAQGQARAARPVSRKAGAKQRTRPFTPGGGRPERGIMMPLAGRLLVPLQTLDGSSARRLPSSTRRRPCRLPCVRSRARPPPPLAARPRPSQQPVDRLQLEPWTGQRPPGRPRLPFPHKNSCLSFSLCRDLSPLLSLPRFPPPPSNHAREGRRSVPSAHNHPSRPPSC
jgi:hypothetical protein